MKTGSIVVIGASAGGEEAIVELVAGLPRDLPAAVCIALHIGARPSNAPELFGRAGRLPAVFAAQGAPLLPGCIYVAPPDHHLLVAPGRLHLSRGPQGNRTRPAVDPLFRTAAEAYGPAAIGVILSGLLSDGTAGLSAIKGRGGTSVVQDPQDALYPGMPNSALAHVLVDHCVPVSGMAGLLVRLTKGQEGGPPPSAVTPARAKGTVPPTATPRETIRMDGEYELK